jgi:hypothetical protein
MRSIRERMDSDDEDDAMAMNEFGNLLKPEHWQACVYESDPYLSPDAPLELGAPEQRELELQFLDQHLKGANATRDNSVGGSVGPGQSWVNEL